MFGYLRRVSLDGWLGVSQASPSDHCSALRSWLNSVLRKYWFLLVSWGLREFCAESWFLSTTVFQQDLGVAWLVPRGCLAKWKHWLLLSLEVICIWDEALGLILWSSDSQTFHQVLHIIRSFNSEQILSPTLDREWGSASLVVASSVALEISQKKVMKLCWVTSTSWQHPLLTGFLLLITGYLYFLVVSHSHSEQCWGLKSVLRKEIIIRDNWGF